MAITNFAAIDVGSNGVSLKIFEINKKFGIREIDYVRHTIELGAETYNTGKISHSLVNELCEVLLGFTDKMKEYNIVNYTAYATSAVREAANCYMILDQIRLRSGLKVKILSNSEERFLSYKAIASNETAFQNIIKKGTLIVDVGAGSIQISIFDKETLAGTQNIKLGSLRIREILSNMEQENGNFYNLISEYISEDILTFREQYLKNRKIEHIIAVADNFYEVISFLTKTKENTINHKTFAELFQSIRLKPIESLSEELHISSEQASLILPAAMIYYKMLEETDAKSMWLPGVTLCDGIAAEYAERKEKIISAHDFNSDIIASARMIADRYHCNLPHTENVEYLALSIFDCIRKLHGLGKRERLLLQIAVILHNCGQYINMGNIYKNSYHIIRSTEIIGLSHLERQIVANIVRYYDEEFPSAFKMDVTFDKETYIKISKLSAIFQIANGMDFSKKQKFNQVKLNLKGTELVIMANTLEDITLERGLFQNRAAFFEEVYGIHPIIKQKRSI